MGSETDYPRFIIFSQRDWDSSIVGLGHTLEEAEEERDDIGRGFIWDSEQWRWVDE